MTKREKAMSLFLEGYNCTQSVVGAFEEEIGLEHDVLMRLSSGFGGGMGRLREVCGAVSGMFFVVNCFYGYSDPKDTEAKKELYKKIQTLAAEYKALRGTYICRELLGIKTPGASDPVPEARTAEYYKKRPCKEIIGDAAEILDRFLKEWKQK